MYRYMSNEYISVIKVKILLQKKFNVIVNLDFLAKIQNNFLQSV